MELLTQSHANDLLSDMCESISEGVKHQDFLFTINAIRGDFRYDMNSEIEQLRQHYGIIRRVAIMTADELLKIPATDRRVLVDRVSNASDVPNHEGISGILYFWQNVAIEMADLARKNTINETRSDIVKVDK